MRYLVTIILCLFAFTAEARYVRFYFIPVAGADYYTVYWGETSGVYDKSLNLMADDGTVDLYDSTTTYRVGDHVFYEGDGTPFENRFMYECIQESRGNLPTNGTYWDGPYFAYYPSTGYTQNIPINEATTYATVTATDGTGESAESGELTIPSALSSN